MFSDANEIPSYAEPTDRLPKPPYVTYVLIGINILIFILTLNQQSHIWGGNNHYFTVEQGEYYRLITAMFLHANLIHIAFNMFALYNIGRTLEGFIGHLTYGIVYFVSGLAGSILSMTLNTGNSTSVGASGAVVGVFAAEIVFIYRHKELFGENANAALKNSAITILINLAIGLSPGLNIDNWGHLGGFIGGLITFLVMDLFFIDLRYQPAGIGQYFLVLIVRQRGILLGLAGSLAVVMLYLLSTVTPLLSTRQFEDGNLQIEVPPGWVIVTDFTDNQFCAQESIDCVVTLQTPSGLTLQIDHYTAGRNLNSRDISARVELERDGGESVERHLTPIDGHNAIQHVYEFPAEKRMTIFIETDTSIVEVYILGSTSNYNKSEDTIQKFIDGIRIE